MQSSLFRSTTLGLGLDLIQEEEHESTEEEEEEEEEEKEEENKSINEQQRLLETVGYTEHGGKKICADLKDTDNAEDVNAAEVGPPGISLTSQDNSLPPGILTTSKKTENDVGKTESPDDEGKIGSEELPQIYAGPSPGKIRDDRSISGSTTSGSKKNIRRKSRALSITNSFDRSMKKEHRRSIARQRRASKADAITFESAAKKVSRRKSRIREMKGRRNSKFRRNSKISSAKRRKSKAMKLSTTKTSSSGTLPPATNESKNAEHDTKETSSVKEWLRCTDRRGLMYWLNMSSRQKEWVLPEERKARRRLPRDQRVRPPGLNYFDESAEMNSDDEFSSEDDLEPIPEIVQVLGEDGEVHHNLLPPRTQEFSKVFGLLRLSRDEIDALMPAVLVREFPTGKIILEGKMCEETLVICRYGEIRVVNSSKSRSLFGRSAGQKYGKIHKGDAFGSCHALKKDVKRLESTEHCEVLILEHCAIAPCIRMKIQEMWEEYQKNERQRRLQIKLRKQAILQSKMAKKRGNERRGSRVGMKIHARRNSESHQKSSLRDFADRQLDGGRDMTAKNILKGHGDGARRTTRGLSMRRSHHIGGMKERVSIKGAARRASKRLSISILQDKEQSRPSLSSGSRPSISDVSAKRKSTLSSVDAKDDEIIEVQNHNLDREDPISSKDMSFEDAMAASKRAEAQNLRTMEYLSSYSERLQMEEEDNEMQVIHKKDIAESRRLRRQRRKDQDRRNMMMMKKEELQRKAKRIQRERKRRDRKEKLRLENERKERERKERERQEKLKLERAREKGEREAMENEERCQRSEGDLYWGIDLAEERRQAELKRRLEEKIANWKRIGETRELQRLQKRAFDGVRRRRKYMDEFWSAAVPSSDPTGRVRSNTSDAGAGSSILTDTPEKVSVTVSREFPRRKFFFVEENRLSQRDHSRKQRK